MSTKPPRSLAHQLLEDIPGLRLLGPHASRKTGIVSFVVDGVHPHDIAHVLNERGIAIRAGQHCAMPLHRRLGISASARASFYLYNTTAEVEALAAALRETVGIFSRRQSARQPFDSVGIRCFCSQLLKRSPGCRRQIWKGRQIRPLIYATARTLLASSTYSFATIRNRSPGRCGMSPELTEYMTEIRSTSAPAASRNPREVHRAGRSANDAASN